jgi:Cdc6-like AAA superfamily ATPase
MISVAELVQFWENLRTAVAIDGILAFDPVPSFWGAIPNRLFVRKSYHDIAEIIFEKVKYGEETGTDIGTSGFAITGNPGIGKSVFLFYFMWQLRKKFPEADVVVHRAKDNPFLYVFSNRGCFKTSDYVFVANEFLDKPFTWYLTDTLPNGPSAVSAKTIVVASPARPHYKEFLKYPKTSSLLYLPVWSLEELLLARGIFGLSAATVEERFNLIGGIARFVLEKPESPETTVENVLSRLNMENFTQLIDGSIVGEDRISHLIIHYAVTGNYQKFSLQFASGNTFSFLLN